MDENRKKFHDVKEEMTWQVQVLRRTARVCNAKAKMYERMLKEDARVSAMDPESLRIVLKRIDNAMEWRFVDAMGEVQLDADMFAESIDCATLRAIRECVVYALEELEGAEK